MPPPMAMRMVTAAGCPAKKPHGDVGTEIVRPGTPHRIFR